MADYTLPRTGDRPLAFRGELLAESDGEVTDGQHNNRYHALALYRTASGRLVAHVAYHTEWVGEQESSTVYVADTPADLADALKSHNPCSTLVGMPRGMEARQASRDEWVRSRYLAQVGEVLSVLEPEQIP